MSMTPTDITKYKTLYLQTSWGYLNMLRKNMAFLEKGVQIQNAVEACHLAAHSLKSQSLLMGYNQIGKFSESMEMVFKESKDKGTVPDSQPLAVINQGLDKVEKSLTQISENGGEVDLAEEIGKLTINN